MAEQERTIDKDAEALRKAYDEEKTDGNFERLVAKMNLGDAIWYVEQQDLFRIERARRIIRGPFFALTE